MKQQLRQATLKMLVVLLIIGGIFSASPLASLAATTDIVKDFNTTSGVNFKDIRISYSSGTNQAIQVMKVNVADSNTFVELGAPSYLNQLQKTTTHALTYHRDGHAVVGAINGSFFHTGYIVGAPMNLISQKNRLIHAGEVYATDDKFVNEPIAFGIDRNGKGIIDYYQLNLSFLHNGTSYPITSTNFVYNSETTLFTSYFNSSTTNSSYPEVTVTLPSQPVLELGGTITGTVTEKSETGKSAIPKNGFVLSGKSTENIQIGDEITISVNIDDKWKNSQFMLASGPMLVKDGKVNLTMDPNSSNARTRAPRTAVAIDKTGSNVYFITVDGRQTGYSNGMNLTEFAQYLVSLGVDRAINLDGGGSTTMAVRPFGSETIQLANSPSGGSQRAVSTILMAVSTAPIQLFSDVNVGYWAESAIKSLFKEGVVSGYPDGSFKPKASLTRTEAAIMLTKELDLNTSNVVDPGFLDVKSDYKYYKEIAAAANAGLFVGRGEGNFVPQGKLTRAEMAIILQKAYKIASTDKKFFPDVKSSHWAYDAVNAIANAGITGGYPDGTYKLDNLVTRAEFSSFLTRK